MPPDTVKPVLPQDLLLERIPHDKTHTLKAYDAADSLLIEYKGDYTYPLIVNDAFGALTLSLIHDVTHPLLSLSDSYISQQALRKNAAKHNISNQFKLLSSLEPVPSELAPKIDCVMMKLPKSAQYFEYQLGLLNHYLPVGTQVMIGGMVKYMSKAFFDIAHTQLSDVSTSLAVKKARLIFAKTQGSLTAPALYTPFKEHTKHLTLYDCPNGFSRGKLDIGSRFLLEHFPDVSDKQAILDIGCGCGVLGLTAAKLNPKAHITLIDESYHAIAATEHNIQTNFSATDPSRFLVMAGHNMDAIASNSQNMVLCNPPFHQGNTVGTQVAQSMFKDAKRVLAPQGELIVIANRHLNYHQALKKIFGHAKVSASNKKFVVLSCQA